MDSPFSNALPCDIFLGAHGGYFGLTDKYPRWKAGDQNAFIDPAGYKAYIADREQAFEAELQRQSVVRKLISDSAIHAWRARSESFPAQVALCFSFAR